MFNQSHIITGGLKTKHLESGFVLELHRHFWINYFYLSMIKDVLQTERQALQKILKFPSENRKMNSFEMPPFLAETFCQI